jgi:hypothetical protein
MKIREIIKEEADIEDMKYAINLEVKDSFQKKDKLLLLAKILYPDDTESQIKTAIDKLAGKALDKMLRDSEYLVSVRIQEIQDDEEYEEYEVVANEIYNIIMDDCSDYIKEYPRHRTTPLLRGQDLDNEKYNIFNIRQGRKPVDTPMRIHNMFVDIFKKVGIDARRDNSIFASGSWKQIKQYGEPGVVYPLNGYKYSWSSEVIDLFKQWEKLFNSTNVKVINQEELFNSNLKYAQTQMGLYIRDRPSWENKNFTFKDFKKLSEKDQNQIMTDIIKFNDSVEVQYDTTELERWVDANFNTTAISEAIDREVEILITGKQFLLISHDFWAEHIRPKFEK